MVSNNKKHYIAYWIKFCKETSKIELICKRIRQFQTPDLYLHTHACNNNVSITARFTWRPLLHQVNKFTSGRLCADTINQYISQALFTFITVVLDAMSEQTPPSAAAEAEPQEISVDGNCAVEAEPNTEAEPNSEQQDLAGSSEKKLSKRQQRKLLKDKMWNVCTETLMGAFCLY